MARAVLSVLLLALLAGSALAQQSYKSSPTGYNSPQAYQSPSYPKSPSYYKPKPIVFTIYAKLANQSDPIFPETGSATGVRVISLLDALDYQGYKIGYLTGYVTDLFGNLGLNKYTVVLKGGSIQVISTDDLSLVYNAGTVVGGTGKYSGLTGYVSTQALTVQGASAPAYKLIFYLLDDSYYSY